MLPSTDDLDKMDQEKMKYPKKSNKKKSKRKKYEMESSVISIDPSSMPSCIAPEPPSGISVGYENYKPYANVSPPSEAPDYSNDYLVQKPDTKKIYSTTEGAEYYVVDNDNQGKKNRTDTKQRRENFKNMKSESEISQSKDYENLKEKPINPLDVKNVPDEEPQELYEPMDL